MPRGDRTGPAGYGPMTGRAAGFCAGFDRPGFMSAGSFGRGFGRGLAMRFGRGFRGFFRGAPGAWYGPADGYAAPNDAAGELSVLKKQAEYLAQDMESINKRISELETGES